MWYFPDEYWANHPELHDVPIYYASSLAKKCMSVYQTYIEAMNESIRQQISISNPFVFKHISNLKVRYLTIGHAGCWEVCQTIPRAGAMGHITPVYSKFSSCCPCVCLIYGFSHVVWVCGGDGGGGLDILLIPICTDLLCKQLSLTFDWRFLLEGDSCITQIRRYCFKLRLYLCNNVSVSLHYQSMEHFEDIGPSVVMASPGMMQSGLSRELFESWCTDKRNGTIIAGYCVEGTLAKVCVCVCCWTWSSVFSDN